MSPPDHSTRRVQLHGPPFALPRAVDACSERWWRLPARARFLAAAVVVLVLAAAGEVRIRTVQQRWGGPPRTALVAIEHGNIGDPPQVRSVPLPPAMVPSGAPSRVAADDRLALALPEGGVLTSSHLSPRGAAAGVDDDRRVVPLPTPPGLDLAAGGAVDVWVLDAGTSGSRRVATGRAVVTVADDADDDGSVALVALATDEVGPVMQGLAQGDVVLTQAPP